MSNIVIYETPQGKVELSPEIIRRYLVNGNGKVTDQEVMMFLQLCKYQKLNPFLRECYLIKYGDEPATIVTGKETFTKRAASIPDCDGWIAGVVVLKNGKIVYRPGSLVLKDEELVGGWAEVYRKNWSHPVRIEVSYREYEGKKRDGTPNRQWRRMPGTMVRKVALVQGLREAFPIEFGDLYSPEEMAQAGVDMDELPKAEVIIPGLEKKEVTPKEEAQPLPEKKSSEKLSPQQKEVLNLWKQLNLSRWQKEPIDVVVEKASDKKLKAMIDWAKKKLAEKEVEEHTKAQAEKLREEVLELVIITIPTNKELEEMGFDTGISLEDQLKGCDYSKLKEIREKLLKRLSKKQRVEWEKTRNVKNKEK